MIGHEDKVKKKYDTLFQAENRFRKGGAYPIHKKLDFKGLPYVDIYDWLIDNIRLLKGDSVLDAGCGVGYGSILMATEKAVHVDGISLSTSEISQARKNIAKYNLSGRVVFKVQSYDNLGTEMYDTIIAIESVKHSADLKKTLNGFRAALKPKGQVVIIEDLYQLDDLNTDGELLTADYKLIDLFRLSNYTDVLPEEDCQVIDLNDYVLPKILWKINLKLAISKFINKIRGRSTSDISSILRGGYYLDRLYASGFMKYKVIIYTKPSQT